MKQLARCTLALLLLASPAAALHASPADEEAVRAVIESFHQALHDKDRDAYLALFLPGPVRWQSVMDDVQLARERRRNPEATRAWFDPDNTHLGFIDNAVGNPKVGGVPSPPAFPIRVESDGDVASASQQYRFHYEGREVGRGLSIWLLARTEDGWKITSVVYSKRQPQAD